MPSCNAITESGTKCDAPAMEGSCYCFFHNPDPLTTQKRKEAAQAGGSNSKCREPLSPVSVKNQDELALLLELTVNEVRTGKLRAGDANCIGYLCSVLAKVFDDRNVAINMDAINLALKGRRENG